MRIYGGPFNRRKGESAQSHCRRCHENYLVNWQREKKSRGEWLSQSEYEKKTGRPGRPDRAQMRW